ncbi:MAG TPA: ATP-binding protein [Methanocorpusculum sp.]|nr:ATP-binding protein [Methanocorpusculum sp.]
MIQRERYLQQLIDSVGNGLVKTITGIRRCGKSVLLKDIFVEWLKSQGVDDEHIIYVSFDDMEKEALRNPHSFLKMVNERMSDDNLYYILLDEVQLMDRFVELLLSLMHKNCDIFVTGSNSRFLSSDIVTEFRGRSQEIHMLPLVFSEFVSAYDGSTEEAWRDYFEYGGLPQILSFKTPQQKITYLSNLVETVYVKDIVERNKLKDTIGLTELLRILASSIGSSSNPSRISNTFESVDKKQISNETISRYIKCLSESFLIKEAMRYDVKGRKYIGTETKYYFSDMGLRNSILGFRQIEENHIMENVIYNELRYRGYNVDVGRVEIMEREEEGRQLRKKLEVDFVANQASKRYYIQSAFRLDDEEKVRQEKRSLLRVPDSFKKIIVVRDNIAPYHDYDGFLRIGLFDFLLKSDSLDM